MKSFKQFIKEMPLLVHSIPRIQDRDESDLNFPIHKSDYAGAKKVSKLDHDNDLYHFARKDNPKSQAYLVVHRRSKRIKANITGHEEHGEFHIGWTGKHSTSNFNMTDVYHHIVQNHQTLVSSQEHSPGSYNNWKKLSERPDIEMSTRYNSEPDTFHSDWRKNYTDPKVYDGKHQLVAKKRK